MANSAGESAPGKPLQCLEGVSERLRAQRRELGCWERVAAVYSLSVGTVVRVSNGYDPRRAYVRAALSLPARIELSPANGATASPGALFLRSSISCACGCGACFVPGSSQQLYLAGHRKHRRRAS